MTCNDHTNTLTLGALAFFTGFLATMVAFEECVRACACVHGSIDGLVGQ